jgi:c-di-GMP-binding flagellar brake protein YcgR
MTFDEKRKFTRHDYIAEVKYRSNCPPVRARISDISEGGIFIDIITPLPANTMVTVSFYIPDANPDSPITGSGKVVWAQETVGMGIEFVNLDEKIRERLKKYLADI